MSLPLWPNLLLVWIVDSPMSQSLAAVSKIVRILEGDVLRVYAPSAL